MSVHTTVNPQRAAEKLRDAIGVCSPHGYTTIPVSLVLMAARAIEQQQARIAELESAQQAMDAALREAASVEVVE